MSRSFPASSAARAAGLSLGFALAGQAAAVHLDPHGAGQVLLYPYYTVNQGQQTYLTVANTSGRAKAIQLDFREGHAGHSVLSLRIYLAPYDSWTGTVFAIADAVAGAGDGVGVLSADESCTTPSFATQAHGTVNGQPYLRLSTAAYQGDPGAQGEARLREGHVEVVALADLTGSLASAIVRGPGGAPADCAAVTALAAPTAETLASEGGLLGTGAIVNVDQGTYFPYRATALGGFTSRPLVVQPGTPFDPLAEAGDPAAGAAATVVLGASTIEAAYPADRRIDAVSATLIAESLYNEYLMQRSIGAQSDWVVTFPTKRFYTAPGAAAVAPFSEPFGPDGSCLVTHLVMFSREGGIVTHGGLGAPFAEPQMCYSTNVLSFVDGPPFPPHTAVLGSRLRTLQGGLHGTAGSATLRLGSERAALRSSSPTQSGEAGYVFHGLPVIGFWATNLVNGAVADGVLANYGSLVPHARTIACTSGEAACD